jgi:hypothetical protein
MSWEKGILSIQWRQASVKFLKKMNKSSYNIPSAYRPIRLTGVVGKLMERIVTSRLETYLESNNILDKEQEGFRHFRLTTNALLTFVQSIFNGINQKESTVAVLIDLEKAFDSVWREGLLVELAHVGVKDLDKHIP